MYYRQRPWPRPEGSHGVRARAAQEPCEPGWHGTATGREAWVRATTPPGPPHAPSCKQPGCLSSMNLRTMLILLKMFTWNADFIGCLKSFRKIKDYQLFEHVRTRKKCEERNNLYFGDIGLRFKILLALLIFVDRRSSFARLDKL